MFFVLLNVLPYIRYFLALRVSFLWELHSPVDDKVLIQPEKDERAHKNVQRSLLFFSVGTILKVVFHLNGQLPTDGIEAIQKPQQAAGRVMAGL